MTSAFTVFGLQATQSSHAPSVDNIKPMQLPDDGGLRAFAMREHIGWRRQYIGGAEPMGRHVHGLRFVAGLQNRIRFSVGRALRSASEPDFNLPSNTLFVIKNGLSALLMSAIWRESGHDVFSYAYNDNADHQADVETVLEGLPAQRVSLSRLPSEFRRSDAVLVSTLSNSMAGEARRRMSARARHYIVQHGTVELAAYVERRDAFVERNIDGFYLFFANEIRAHVAATGRRPEPCRAYPKIQGKPLSVGSPDVTAFAMQPMLDDGALSVEDFDAAVHRFLDRRRPMTYKILPHPRQDRLSIERFEQILSTRGLPHHVEDPPGPLEIVFPQLDAAEISTFYSTAAYVCGEIYGCAFDTMVDELMSARTLERGQKQQIQLLWEMLPNARRFEAA